MQAMYSLFIELNGAFLLVFGASVFCMAGIVVTAARLARMLMKRSMTRQMQQPSLDTSGPP
jgi:hypothetical protein